MITKSLGFEYTFVLYGFDMYNTTTNILLLPKREVNIKIIVPYYNWPYMKFVNNDNELL